jgi:hypothetical protein
MMPWLFAASASLTPALASFFVDGFASDVLQLFAIVTPAILLMLAVGLPTLHGHTSPSSPLENPAGTLPGQAPVASPKPSTDTPPMVPAEVHEELAGRLAASAIENQKLRDSVEQLTRALQASHAESKQLAQSNRALRDQVQSHGFSPTPIEELTPPQLDDYRRRLADELKRTDAVIKKRGDDTPGTHRPQDHDSALFG